MILFFVSECALLSMFICTRLLVTHYSGLSRSSFMEYLEFSVATPGFQAQLYSMGILKETVQRLYTSHVHLLFAVSSTLQLLSRILFKAFSQSKCNFSFILQIFIEYLLCAKYYLVVGNVTLNKTDKYPYPNGANVSSRRRLDNKTSR